MSASFQVRPRATGPAASDVGKPHEVELDYEEQEEGRQREDVDLIGRLGAQAQGEEDAGDQKGEDMTRPAVILADQAGHRRGRRTGGRRGGRGT